MIQSNRLAWSRASNTAFSKPKRGGAPGHKKIAFLPVVVGVRNGLCKFPSSASWRSA